ncbi:NAD-dependent epimerase/dehydratase family protein [Paludisphaera borealis]|uniref:Uronate dehydrogenase n=1 Tax=Paludisphaera borealis TaxID=1387353 RepID=A0A1U7CQA8_9BACT|nr:NAD(P)-dependent oxidoreductase [Paludisphaera borealis]APW61089.1 Uronate dehydrogenase [Paludisphaera borealis]
MRPDSTNDNLGDETIPFPPPLNGGLPIIDPDDDFLEDDGEFDSDDEMDGLDGDDEPRTVLITGACGNLGRKLRAAWADVYDLILLDVEPGEDDPDVFKVDLSVFDEDWITHFHGVDTVVHLAANPDSTASLEDLAGPNVDALANVFNASALAGIERIVYASSNHVMSGCRDDEPELIGVDLPPKPSGPYGILKYVGERFGQSLAHAFDVTFIGLRLGYIQEGANRPETLEDDWSRKMWLSNGDLVRLFDAAVEAEIEDRLFLVVNGVSRNHGTPWDLSDAAEVLGYLPEDDAFASKNHPEPVDETV